MKQKRWLIWTVILALLSTFTLTASAAGAPLSQVIDQTGMLSDLQRTQLEQRAAEISSRYDFGIYIYVVDDYRTLSDEWEIYDAGVDVYERSHLGSPRDGAGTMLLLSMNGREYSLDFNEDRADYAFTEVGRDQIEEDMLSYFRRDDFFGGFYAYLDCCEEYLRAAEEGHPVGTKTPASKIGPSLLIGLAAAGITGACLAAPMRSAKEKHQADQYVVPGSLHLTRRSDMFLRRSVSRRAKPKNNSSGSTHHSSGSHSGRSGRF